MEHARLPVSKAKTAYGILSEVVRLVRKEPKRMRMAIWGGHRGNANLLNNTRYGAGPAAAPACGTIGCIGGWMEFLTGHKLKAWQVLGMEASSDVTDDLFFGPLCHDSDQGTVKHARRVISHIRKFQRQNRRHLLKTKVR